MTLLAAVHLDLLEMLGSGLRLYRLLLTIVRIAVVVGMMNPMLFENLLFGLPSRKRMWHSNGIVRKGSG
jgi:hypothetical protein